MISGLWAALPHIYERFSRETIQHALESLIQQGVNGFLVLGTTGRGPDFCVDERKAFLETLVTLTDPGQVIVGVSANPAPDVHQLTVHAFDVGVRGVAITPPFYGTFSDSEIQEWAYAGFGKISKTAQVYLYNIPSVTRNRWNASLLTAIDKVVGVDGIKDSSGQIEELNAFIEWAEPRAVSVLVGNERLATYGYCVGAKGIVSGLSCAFPALVRDLIRANEAHDCELAARLQKKVNARLQLLHAQTPRESGETLIAWMQENQVL